MPIGAWIIDIVVVIIIFVCGVGCCIIVESTVGKIFSIVIPFIISIILIATTLWYYSSTASGRRAMIDQKSELSNGLDRIVTIYTADGNIIAQFKGKIDIEGNDGGYVLFDFEGKRYTYYNCFVESIAEID